MATLEDVAKIVADLPEVTEEDRRGNRSWAVGGRTFAWERSFSKADLKRYGDEPAPAGPILAVRVADLGEKEAVLAENHRGFFTIPHFNGYTAILIQLDKASPKPLRNALVDGWLTLAPRGLAEEFLAR